MPASSPLFLGLDVSTQAIKAVVLDQHLKLVQEARVGFDEDLPQWKTTNGVFVDVNGEKGAVKAPVMMYVEALDMVLDRLKAE